MLMIPSSVKVFLASQPVDMRRSFDGLSAMTREIIRQDPLSGHLFVFRGRRGDRLKLLVWDRSGYWLYYKRLEEGTFRFPPATADGGIEVAPTDLALLLEGIDLAGAKRQRRYQGTPTPTI